MKKILITIEKTGTGLSAYSKDFSGIFTAASDFEELKKNIKEVIDYQIDYLIETDDLQQATELKNSEIEYAVDFQQFFEYFSMINKSEFAKYIGINPSLFRQYTKGIVPVSDQRMAEIEKGIHKLAKDLSDVSFI